MNLTGLGWANTALLKEYSRTEYEQSLREYPPPTLRRWYMGGGLSRKTQCWMFITLVPSARKISISKQQATQKRICFCTRTAPTAAQRWTEVTMADLKLCPFCGGKVSLVLCDDEGNLHDEAYRERPYSGVGFMLRHTHEENPSCPIASYECDGGILGGVYIYDTEERAAEAWNRRAEND